MLALRKIENVATGPNNRPKLTVKIVGESCDRPRRAFLYGRTQTEIPNRVRGDVRDGECNVLLACAPRRVSLVYFCTMKSKAE